MEIQLTTRLQVAKGYLKLTRDRIQNISMTGTRYSAGVQDIGFAAHEALTIGSDVGTAGWGEFRNLDTTNFVQIGLDVAGTFYPFAKLLPGESFPVPLATKDLYAKADTAAVQLELTVLER